MKKFFALTILSVIVGTTAPNFAATQNIGTVSFKKCLETSKIGMQEQTRFDQMRKQMEQSIEQKEKELKELSPKFTEEYLDTLTPEAEEQLKEKFKNLSQDLTQQQNQYYQVLNQTNMQVVQKLFDMISEASKTIAKEKNLDIILNDETCFFHTDATDVSSLIIKKLDEMFDQSEKK